MMHNICPLQVVHYTENWPFLWTCIVFVFGRSVLLEYLGNLSSPLLWTWKFSPNGVIHAVDGLVSVQLEFIVIRPLYGLVITKLVVFVY